MSNATTTTRTTIYITADGVLAGQGYLVDGEITGCPAALSEAAYETIEDAIGNGDESCEHDGVSYSWWTETA